MLTSLTLTILALPDAGVASDTALCADLYKRLNNAPQIIGGNANAQRSYARELSALNADIRQLRIDMRRQGCGSGSIVTLGGGDSACAGMQHILEQMDVERERMSEARNGSRSLLQPSEERVALLSAIRESGCTPTDLDVQNDLDEHDRVRIRGLALPRPEETENPAAQIRSPSRPLYDGTSITRFGNATPSSTSPEQIEFPPDRPYDPDKKVRMVGPQFLPSEEIDLANPKVSGPQPLQ